MPKVCTSKMEKSQRSQPSLLIERKERRRLLRVHTGSGHSLSFSLLSQDRSLGVFRASRVFCYDTSKGVTRVISVMVSRRIQFRRPRNRAFGPLRDLDVPVTRATNSVSRSGVAASCTQQGIHRCVPER